MSVNKISIVTLSKHNYTEAERWNTFFEKGKTLADIPYHLSWIVMFEMVKKDARYKQLNEKLKSIVEKNKSLKIYPLPDYTYAAFLATPASEIKVVFIGQDPYFNCEYEGKEYVPQAMGLSFSVPNDITLPSSLANIFRNMKKFGHIKSIPRSGNLWFWAAQGCLMLNAALTVEDSTKEAHLRYWEWFTDYIIQYISTYMDGVIFVLWGGYAFKKKGLIDEDRHHTIISSHPSGLSANKKFGKYPAFMEEDHFGKINHILEKSGRLKILWE